MSDEVKERLEREERIEDELAQALNSHAHGLHRAAAKHLIRAWKLMAGFSRDYASAPKWADGLFDDADD